MTKSTRYQLNRRRLGVVAAGAVLAAQAHRAFAENNTRRIDASPEVSPASEPPIARFLACTPASFLEVEADSGWPLWSYSDLEQQFAAVGVTSLFDFPRAAAATRAIYLRCPFLSFFDIPEFSQALGFEAGNIRQLWQSGSGENQINMFVTDAPANILTEAWELAGYERFEVENGLPIWRILGEDAVDFDHPIQKYAWHDCDNVTITEDGVIAFASSVSVLESIVQSSEPMMLSIPEVADLVNQLPADIVGCECVSGRMHTVDRLYDFAASNSNLPAAGAGLLIENAAEMVEASDRSVGPIPVWSYMIMGAFAGLVTDMDEFEDPGDQRGLCLIHAGNSEEAIQVAKVVEFRWQDGREQTDGSGYFNIAEISSVGTQEEISILEFEPVREPQIFADIQRETLMWPFLHGQVEDTST